MGLLCAVRSVVLMDIEGYEIVVVGRGCVFAGIHEPSGTGEMRLDPRRTGHVVAHDILASTAVGTRLDTSLSVVVQLEMSSGGQPFETFSSTIGIRDLERVVLKPFRS